MGSDTLVIAVDDVPTRVCVGVSAEERARPQALVISTALHLAAGARFQGRDRLSETIDYGQLIRFVKQDLAEASPPLLIETVADRVATFAFTLDAAIEAVDVRVAKPSVLGADGLVSVRLHRRRP